MNNGFSMQRMLSVARKEFRHSIRDPVTLLFAFCSSLLELFMLGYAINTNVSNVPTVLFDACNTKDSENLVRAFENSKDFRILPHQVYSDLELSQTIVAGKAKVGIIIPQDYSKNLESRRT